MIIIIVVVLVAIVFGLLAYNVVIHRKIQDFKNTDQKIKSLNVLQEFMSTIGEESTVDGKISKINTRIIIM